MALLMYESISGVMYLDRDEPELDLSPLLSASGMGMVQGLFRNGVSCSEEQWRAHGRAAELTVAQATSLLTFLDNIVFDIAQEYPGGALPVMNTNGFVVDWSLAQQARDRMASFLAAGSGH